MILLTLIAFIIIYILTCIAYALFETIKNIKKGIMLFEDDVFTNSIEDKLWITIQFLLFTLFTIFLAPVVILLLGIYYIIIKPILFLSEKTDFIKKEGKND